MPLKKSKSKRAFNYNVSELIHAYKKKGKIGKVKPKNAKKARQIALAIAFKIKRRGK
jgi:hypothetical protein